MRTIGKAGSEDFQKTKCKKRKKTKLKPKPSIRTGGKKGFLTKKKDLVPKGFLSQKKRKRELAKKRVSGKKENPEGDPPSENKKQ